MYDLSTSGYVGEECDSVCNLNPCQNGGYCLHDKDSPLGYSCVCNTTVFTGNYYPISIGYTFYFIFVNMFFYPLCLFCN